MLNSAGLNKWHLVGTDITPVHTMGKSKTGEANEIVFRDDSHRTESSEQFAAFLQLSVANRTL